METAFCPLLCAELTGSGSFLEEGSPGPQGVGLYVADVTCRHTQAHVHTHTHPAAPPLLTPASSNPPSWVQALYMCADLPSAGVLRLHGRGLQGGDDDRPGFASCCLHPQLWDLGRVASHPELVLLAWNSCTQHRARQTADSQGRLAESVWTGWKAPGGSSVHVPLPLMGMILECSYPHTKAQRAGSRVSCGTGPLEALISGGDVYEARSSETAQFPTTWAVDFTPW